MFSKAKIQYLKHACSRSWVCINRGMSKLCFTIEMHAEELSSADATWLHCVLQSVVSGVAVHLLKSADSVIERHVLLNACFFVVVVFVFVFNYYFWVHNQRSNSESVIYMLCHTTPAL